MFIETAVIQNYIIQQLKLQLKFFKEKAAVFYGYHTDLFMSYAQ